MAPTGSTPWDVDVLVALADGLPVEDVSLRDIAEIDTHYWSADERGPTVRELVDHLRLVNEVDLSYPILLGPDGRLLDGMHRVVRSMLEGRTTIAAIRLPALPPATYVNCHPRDLLYPEG